jgi:hypothetical protein
MIYGIRRMVQYAFGTDIAGRNLAVYPDDLFIVSYPRSGNTWTRFLIANLLHPDEPATFANIERLAPDSEAQSNRYLKRIPRPRVIKSHQYFDPRYRRVVYIVRDPRDVALSYYDFARKYRHIQDGYPVADYVSDFVRGKLSSADWGTWAENVGSWIAARGTSENFLLLRYEDMISDTPFELRRVAEFLNIDASQDRITQTVERSSAETMRELEKTQSNDWVSTKNKRPDVPFVRTAVSGGWKDKLPQAAAQEIAATWKELMTKLGYVVDENRLSAGHDPIDKLGKVGSLQTPARSRM